jgi:hypothetical protein
MVLSGKRGIHLRDLDRIAVFLETTPAELIEDPELTFPQDGAQSVRFDASAPAALEARIARQRRLIARQQAIIEHERARAADLIACVRAALDEFEQARLFRPDEPTEHAPPPITRDHNTQ